jgi:NAD(P)-dependent dehydrogenase (short-subunit alcohol dehydrogenase family)
MLEAGAPAQAPFDMRTFYNPDLLAGRVAIVTGGATGIGRVAARGLAQVGATVVLASRKEEHLRRSAENLRSEKLRAAWKKRGPTLEVAPTRGGPHCHRTNSTSQLRW